MDLIPHPTTPCPGVTRIEAEVTAVAGGVRLTYHIGGQMNALLLPGASATQTAGECAPEDPDPLWKHTCCEVFFRQEGKEGYAEYNFSPSGRWARYGFRAYRERREPGDTLSPFLILPPSLIVVERTPEALTLEVTVPLDPALCQPSSPPLLFGLSAVVEQAAGGGVSYWALRHPSPKPDFHHPDSFVRVLPPVLPLSGKVCA